MGLTAILIRGNKAFSFAVILVLLAGAGGAQNAPVTSPPLTMRSGRIGTGAAVGAAAGAAAGTIGVLLTRGDPTIIAPETLLAFQVTTGSARGPRRNSSGLLSHYSGRRPT